MPIQMTAGSQPGWQVAASGGQGADLLTGVEKVTDGAGHHFLLVGNGGYATIQDAVDAAVAGDTIMIAAGNYGGFSVDVAGLNIVAAGNVIIEGPLLTQLGVPPGTPLNDYFEQNHPSYSGATGVTVGANNVTISGLTITGFSIGLELGTSDGVTLTGNTFIDNVTGICKGTAAQVTDLTVNDNTFTHGIHGMTIYAAEDGAGSFDGITMTPSRICPRRGCISSSCRMRRSTATASTMSATMAALRRRSGRSDRTASTARRSTSTSNTRPTRT